MFFWIGLCFIVGDVSMESSYLVNDFEVVGMMIFGKINILEFGLIFFIELEFFGFICNFWNIDYMVGGSFGGSVVVIVVGIVLLVIVSDGGGFICMLVFCCGLFGLKFFCGCLSLGLVVGEMWGGVVVEGCNSWLVCDSVVFLDYFLWFGVGELYYVL